MEMESLGDFHKKNGHSQNKYIFSMFLNITKIEKILLIVSPNCSRDLRKLNSSFLVYNWNIIFRMKICVLPIFGVVIVCF